MCAKTSLHGVPALTPDRRDGMSVTDHWLCLSGGNSLGAFHIGAWSAIEDAGLNVTRIAGASIGAVVGALIAGSPPEDRSACLADFLDRIGRTVFPWSEAMRRSATLRTMLLGHTDLFAPSLPGLMQSLPGVPRDASAFLRGAMRTTLEERVDFGRLNNGEIELSVTALDAESGQIRVFRTGETRLTVDHLMASTALPVLFRPVEIEDRWFMDPGLAENLPLPALLDRDAEATILALDLYGLEGTFTGSLNGVAHRAQDLMFASQSRHVLEACKQQGRVVTHLVLRDPEDDFVGKALDFSHQSLRRYRQLGEQITGQALSPAK